MRYRRLTPSGDYAFGQGSNDFLIDNVEAVAQAVKTRFQLFRETFWRDLSDGVPMFQEILGVPGSPENLSAINNILTQRARGTTGVVAVLDVFSEFDNDLRQYQYQCTIQTQYSVTVLSGTL